MSGDKAVFITCLAALAFIYTDMVYQIGYDLGKEKCLPKVSVPKKSAYDMTPRQLRRMIRYEQSKGGVL
jgi:hypothetical protein